MLTEKICPLVVHLTDGKHPEDLRTDIILVCIFKSTKMCIFQLHIPTFSCVSKTFLTNVNLNK